MTTVPEPGLLETRGVSVRFGGVVALDGVSFEVTEGELVGLIGPNGAGKTTLFNCLSRFCPPAAGSIRFAGRDLLAEPPHRIAALGIGRTFQNLALFATLSVRDNVLVGAHSRGRSGFLASALRLPRVAGEERARGAVADELLEFLGLGPVAAVPVAGLPFATQKRVELARALAAEPRLLLLDEPAGGLNHAEVEGLGRLLGRIRRERRVTMLLVEHHMSLVMQVSDRVVVLDFGRKIADGRPAEIQQDPAVIRAYLGSEAA